jgi:integrase
LVARAKPGRYGDGAGLYLLVRSPTTKFWIFRYVRAGKMREIGLGPAVGRAAVSLADARRRARDLYDAHKAGRDPLEERAAGRALRDMELAKAVTFNQAAERYIESHRAGWSNAKHAAQWVITLRDYAGPIIGRMPVQEVDTGLVVKVLEPIWTAKPVTANRVRARIEAILDWAKARGYRQGENPARWRGHLENLLPNASRVHRIQHHPALPYDQVGAFLVELRQFRGAAALALEFAILTAARSGEVLGAEWDEIAGDIWTVPAGRMKAGKEHRVPLSAPARKVLEQLSRVRGAIVFPALGVDALRVMLRRMGRGDITTHGFRSTFRDWAAERTNYPNEVAEMALGHAVRNQVEAAYRRGDFLDRRRKLMDAWGEFCARPTAGARVVPIRRGTPGGNE